MKKEYSVDYQVVLNSRGVGSATIKSSTLKGIRELMKNAITSNNDTQVILFGPIKEITETYIEKKGSFIQFTPKIKCKYSGFKLSGKVGVDKKYYTPFVYET